MDYINDPENYMKEIAMRAQYNRSLMSTGSNINNNEYQSYIVDNLGYDNTSIDSIDEMESVDTIDTDNNDNDVVNNIDEVSTDTINTDENPVSEVDTDNKDKKSEDESIDNRESKKQTIPNRLKSLFRGKNWDRRNSYAASSSRSSKSDIETSTKKSVIKVIAKTIRKYIWNRFMDYAESIDGPYQVSEDKFNNSVRNWYWSVGFRDIVIDGNRITIYVDRPNKFIGKSNKDDGSTFLTDIQDIFSTLGFSMDIQKAESNEIYRYFFSEE